VILACAPLGDHVVDLWEIDPPCIPAPSRSPARWWACGNDDRSVVGCGYTADDALDAYLALLADARNLAA
jgi:hypothetical protein